MAILLGTIVKAKGEKSRAAKVALMQRLGFDIIPPAVRLDGNWCAVYFSYSKISMAFSMSLFTKSAVAKAPALGICFPEGCLE